jgi:hypothetical protein
VCVCVCLCDLMCVSQKMQTNQWKFSHWLVNCQQKTSATWFDCLMRNLQCRVPWRTSAKNWFHCTNINTLAHQHTLPMTSPHINNTWTPNTLCARYRA